MSDKPLVIDLDGTLLRSDMLLESACAYVKANPHRFYRPLLWLMRGGRAGLKSELARATRLRIESLPFDAEVVAWARREKASGRTLVLATAAHVDLAEGVARHLGLFDRVIATNAGRNLSAEVKRDALVSAFGAKGFDYAGNSRKDLPVWSAAERAHLVNPEPGVERAASRLGNLGKVIETRGNRAGSWIRALRLHQWLKNLLVFVPLLSAHRWSELPLLATSALGFLCFGLAASSAYLVNDLVDLDDDRRHPTKRLRPFAAGELSIKAGALVAPCLIVGALAGALLLSPAFAAVLAGYYALTLGYSFFLKRVVMVDVVVLAMLYTIRIIAGTAMLGTALTFWLLAFSTFIFLSLALVKRYAELHGRRTRGLDEPAHGRGYHPNDLEMISALGGASGYISVLVLALYIQDEATAHLYRYPELIWLACPLLLFWVSRIWLLAHRGLMLEDPVVFAIRDRVSIAVGLLFALVIWLAI
jgi:4-hydroxybenzoate polyprenyltransferase